MKTIGLVFFVLFSMVSVGYSACEGDFDCDGDVDGSDLAVFAADFGRTDCGPCETLWQQNGFDIYYNDGNVGIGTSSPVWELEVANLTAGDGAESAVTADDAGGAIAAYSSTLPDPFAHFGGRVSLFANGETNGLDLRADGVNSDMRFYTDGPWPANERMRITDNGYVGIGTTIPQGGIHVSGNGGNGTALFERSGKILALNPNYGDNNQFAHISTVLGSDMGLKLDVNEQTGMTITPGGNVGIGTTNPSYTLDVVGQIRADSSGGSGIQGYSVNWYGVRGESTIANGVVGVSTSGTGTSGRSTSGTGVSGLSTSGPGVRGNSTESNGVYGVSTNGYAGYFEGGEGLFASSIKVQTLKTPAVTNVCRDSNNYLSFCSSSGRYKENIEDLYMGLEIIEQLRPVKFNWKNTKEEDIGLIAEEVYELEPLLVTYNDTEEIEGVKYRQLTAVLVNAINEQQKQIEKLKAIVCLDHPDADVCK